MPSFIIWPFAIIAAIFLFSLAVFIHELGHFLAARLLGLRADVFSIGFGPALWKKQIRGTEIRFSAIPFGGYVSLPQLDPEGMTKLQGEHGEPLPPAPPWKRIIVAFAGPFGNIVLALLCAALISWYSPKESTGASTTIGFIEQTSPAWEAGLRKGDVILMVNGVAVDTWDNFNQECYLAGTKDTPITLTIQKKDGTLLASTIPLTKEISEKDDVYGVEGILQDPLYYYAEYVQPGSIAANAGITDKDVVRLLDAKPTEATFEVIFGETGEIKTLTLPLPHRNGIILERVDSQGMFAGLQSGDTLIQLNQTPIQSWFDLEESLKNCKENAPITFTVLRQGHPKTISSTYLQEDASRAKDVLLSAPYLFGITDVIPDSPAAEAGLLPGDKILSINGRPITSVNALFDTEIKTLTCLVQTGDEAPRTLTLTRKWMTLEDGTRKKLLGIHPSVHSVNATYAFMHEQFHPNPEACTELLAMGDIGIVPAPFYQPKQWMWMAKRGIYEQLEGDVANVVRVFQALLTPKSEKEAGRAAKGLGGPLMIFAILMKLVQHGLWVSLGFMRLICMNLAILNLLPLPVLDGGHILFALYAMIRRKEPSVKLVGMITNTFAFLLIALMLWFLFSDIMRFL